MAGPKPCYLGWAGKEARLARTDVLEEKERVWKLWVLQTPVVGVEVEV